MITAAIFQPFAVESGLFSWGGREIVATISRLPSESDHISFFDFSTRERIARVPSNGLALICAFAEGGTVHIWGATNIGSAGNQIMHMQSSDPDLLVWSAPNAVWTGASNQKIFNVSVAKNGTSGQYAMVYETSEPGSVDFNARFLATASLSSGGSWSAISAIPFLPNSYTAAFKLAYQVSTGRWVMFYLEYSGGVFRTVVSGTPDFNTWNYSPYPALSPLLPDELNNTSDIEFHEFNGWLAITYAAGNQDSVMDLKQAFFECTEQTFLSWFMV